MKYMLAGMVLLCHFISFHTSAQDSCDSLLQRSETTRGFCKAINNKTASIEKALTRQTDKYLRRIIRHENSIFRRLNCIDSNAAKKLLHDPEEYSTLVKAMRSDTGERAISIGGVYQPYADSLNCMIGYLKNHISSINGIPSVLETTCRQYNVLTAKLEDAGRIRNLVKQRREQIGEYLTQHAEIARALGNQYHLLKEDLYYYSQSLRSYKEMLNDPDKMGRQMLSFAGKIPAFQAFMKDHSQLSGLFSVPGNYGTPEGLIGLQTKDQVAALIQRQIGNMGKGGQELMQSRLQSAQSELAGYKDKVSQLGNSGHDIDMPDFKPNDQKTKTFWKRLELGTNFQTTHNTYYLPTISDLGLSIGYKINSSNVVGVGISYKIGWGNGLQHIALSSEGIGLRSFLELKIKGSFFATGGLEYNYLSSIHSIAQLKAETLWTKSGLIGISKTVSMKSRVLKKTKIQLLWDFLSYQQMPRTQPIIFRIGYGF